MKPCLAGCIGLGALGGGHIFVVAPCTNTLESQETLKTIDSIV